MSLEESPDLKRGVLAALDTAGALTKVRSFMYAQVWAILHHRELNEVDPPLQAKGFISDEDLKVLAYLVRWLTDKGMVNTLTVLELESGRPFKDLPEVDSYELVSSPGTRSPGQSDVGAAFSDMSMEPISEYASPTRDMSSPRKQDAPETIIPIQAAKCSAFTFKQESLFGDDHSQDTNLTVSNASMAPGVSLGPDETSSSRQSPSRMADFSFKYNDRSHMRNSMLSPDTAAHMRQAGNAQGKISAEISLSPTKAQERSRGFAMDPGAEFVTELVIPDAQLFQGNSPDGDLISESQGFLDSSNIPDKNVKTIAELQQEGVLDKTDPGYLESFASGIAESTGQSRQATLNLLDAVGREMQTFDSTLTPGDSILQSGLGPSTLGTIPGCRADTNAATKADSLLAGDEDLSNMIDSAPVDSALTAGKAAARLIGIPAGTTSILTNAPPELNELQDISSIHAGTDDAISTRPQPSLNSELMAGNDFSTGIVLERAPVQDDQSARKEFTLDTYGDISLGVTISNDVQVATRFDYDNIQEDEFGDFEF